VVLLLAAGAALALAVWGHENRGDRGKQIPAIPVAAGSVATVAERLSEARQRAVRTGKPADLAEFARLLHANGYLREAEACWRLLTELTPDDAQVWHSLADLRRIAGDNEEAARLLREVLRLRPDYTPALLHLGNLALKRGDLDTAERDFSRRATLLPDDPHALLGLVRIEQQRGREAAAAALAAKLAQQHPRFSPGVNLHAEYLAQQGDVVGARWQRWLGREAGRFREAEDPWIDGLSAWCFDPKRLGVLGTIAFQTGRPAEAKPLLERAIALAPSAASGYERLGDLALQGGDPVGAVRVLSDGVRRAAPEVPASLWIALAEAHRVAGDPAAALRVAEEGLAALPSTPEIHAARGVALLDLDRASEALVAFDRAREGLPFDAELHFNRALALLHAERTEDAIASLSQALQVQPTFPKALGLLAEVEMSRDNLDAAEPHLRALYDSYPGMQEPKHLLREWHLQKARVALRRGDGAEAQRHREAAQAWAAELAR
jgi:HemY protein